MVAIGKSQSYGNSSRCSRRSNLQLYSNTDTWYCGGILHHVYYNIIYCTKVFIILILPGTCTTKLDG